ncbi:MAG: type II secretion system F family protein [Lachnospiraceae bacterium]|nr:type II secretion system F family protein [Lachnospiraceae bacterium]
MASFGYEAIDSAGKAIKGSIEAEDASKVKQELKKQGLIVVSISEQSMLTKDLNFEIGGKPKSRDLSVFCRQFVSMVRAGVTITDALQMLSEATENKKLKEAIMGVKVSTEKGESLSGAFAEWPKVFPSLMINMVAAGEASGSLDISMERMATQFERSNKTQAQVKKAMTYPLAVCAVAVAVVIVMLVVVIPSYENMFKDMGTELPGITKAMVAVSDFITGNWIVLILVLVGLIFALVSFYKTDAGKYLFQKIVLKIPAFKTFITKSASAQMARTLSTLVAAGVPLVEAVEIVSGTMTNVYFRDALFNARDEIMIGQPLSRPLQDCGLFPPMVYHMIRIGEETGNTEEMMDKLADYYEEEVEMATQTLMAALEPMIIVVLAVIVCFLIAACFAPMLTMYGALDKL